ncbi:MAG: VanZ family protein [Neptuniibacter sp.]
MALKRMSVYLLMPVLCVYLYAGLDGIFTTHNPLSLSDQRGAIVFERGSRAHTEPLFDLNPAANIQIDLSFEYDPENLERGGVIFVVDGPSSGRELILWQWKNQLILMSGDDYSARLRKPRVWVDLPKDNFGPYAVSILLTQNALKFTVSGESYQQAKTLNRPFEFDTEDVRVVLGTNKSHRFPWAGKIHYFSLSSNAGPEKAPLSGFEPVFVFDDSRFRSAEVDSAGYIQSSKALKVKLYVGVNHLKIERRNLQTIKSRLQLPNISPGDLLLNFVGFFPLGILIYIIFSARGFGLASVSAAGSSFVLSLGIELMQLTIPFRDPSQMDLLLNTLGGGSGALIAWCLLKLLYGGKLFC